MNVLQPLERAIGRDTQNRDQHHQGQRAPHVLLPQTLPSLTLSWRGVSSTLASSSPPAPFSCGNGDRLLSCLPRCSPLSSNPPAGPSPPEETPSAPAIPPILSTDSSSSTFEDDDLAECALVGRPRSRCPPPPSSWSVAAPSFTPAVPLLRAATEGLLSPGRGGLERDAALLPSSSAVVSFRASSEDNSVTSSWWRVGTGGGAESERRRGSSTLRAEADYGTKGGRGVSRVNARSFKSKWHPARKGFATSLVHTPHPLFTRD